MPVTFSMKFGIVRAKLIRHVVVVAVLVVVASVDIVVSYLTTRYAFWQAVAE